MPVDNHDTTTPPNPMELINRRARIRFENQAHGEDILVLKTTQWLDEIISHYRRGGAPLPLGQLPEGSGSP